MAIEKELLDQLLAGRDPQDLFAKDGLVAELKKALSERLQVGCFRCPTGHCEAMSREGIIKVSVASLSPASSSRLRANRPLSRQRFQRL